MKHVVSVVGLGQRRGWKMGFASLMVRHPRSFARSDSEGVRGFPEALPGVMGRSLELSGLVPRIPLSEGTALGWIRPPDPVFGDLSEDTRIPSSLVVHMNRKAIVRVLADPVMVFAALSDRIDVYRDPTEVGYVMEKLVADLSGDLMTLSDR